AVCFTLSLHDALPIWVGSSVRGILLGVILVSMILSFLVPSTTARVAAILPIILGMVAAFQMKRESRFAALLVITSAQAASIWNIGVKTAAAQNMVAIGFIEETFGRGVSWGQWFLYAAPFSIIMSIVLYFVMLKLFPLEMNEIPNGKAMVREQLKKLGPLTGAEWRLLVITISLLVLWSTENVLHPFDSASVNLVSVRDMCM